MVIILQTTHDTQGNHTHVHPCSDLRVRFFAGTFYAINTAPVFEQELRSMVFGADDGDEE